MITFLIDILRLIIKGEYHMNIKRVLTIGGAFTAYCIGAGVASGQEILQFYGSWPGSTPFFSSLLVLF